jgi:hypothetical protein
MKSSSEPLQGKGLPWLLGPGSPGRAARVIPPRYTRKEIYDFFGFELLGLVDAFFLGLPALASSG